MEKESWKNGGASTEDMSQRRAKTRRDGAASTLPPIPITMNLSDLFETKCSTTLNSILFPKNKTRT